MPAAAGLVSSSSKSALRELAAILSRSRRRAEDGLLAAVSLAGVPVLDPDLDPALVRVLLILFSVCEITYSIANIDIMPCIRLSVKLWRCLARLEYTIVSSTSSSKQNINKT